MSGFTPFPPWTWEVPAALNIGVACTDRHLGTPTEHQVAMIVEDDALGTSSITYGELAARTGRFAQLLRNLGIEAGERVLVRLPNSIDYPTAFLGTIKRGAIAVPTSTLLTAEEVQYLVKDSGAAAIVIDKAAWTAIGAGLGVKIALLSGAGEAAEVPGVKVLDLESSLAAITKWDPPAATKPDDPAYLVYTSGTTGYPKGVLHGHRSLIGRSPASTYWFDFTGNDRIVHSGKFNWTCARFRAHGPALPRHDRDRARGAQRCRHVAAAHREARCDHVHRRADDLSPDPAEDHARQDRRAHASPLHERGRAFVR
jgi:acetyl-CoA synthetase